jgi:hypothetical protein
MKWPRVLLSFVEQAERSEDVPFVAHPPEAESSTSSVKPSEVPHEMPELLGNTAALRAVLRSSELDHENMEDAREHIRSIRSSWRDFRREHQRDHLMVTMARELEWLDALQALERQHMEVIAGVHARLNQVNVREVDA